jgi:hypothetical protein
MVEDSYGTKKKSSFLIENTGPCWNDALVLISYNYVSI